jgi:hypothetical protein
MSVQLWKVLLPALGLSLMWTACKKDQSATLPEEQTFEPKASGTIEDDPALVNKTPLLLSAEYLTTAHTARKGTGKPGTTTPTDTTTTTTTPTDTTTITPPPATDTTVIAPAPYLQAICSLCHPFEARAQRARA